MNEKENPEKYNLFQLQQFLYRQHKYNAVLIKDFISLTFIGTLLKNTQCIVNFINQQFKKLPKNRKQMKLLFFITQTLKICCTQRKEIFGFKFQIKGRLNRRTRTRK